MSKTRMAAAAMAIGLSIVSAPLVAHHGGAALDSKDITLKGTVIEWFWSNPHCLLQFEVKDAKGQAVRWVGETTNPIELTRSGWTRGSFKPGEQVSVTLRPAKNGRPVGSIRSVLHANGTVFKRDSGEYPGGPAQ